MATQHVIITTLKELGPTFESDELAYLVLTGKVERPVQKLAYKMHLELPPTYTVAREWKGVDVAIFREGKPRTLIELTAMYDFDGHKNAQYYATKMLRDEEKARRLSTEAGAYDADVYSLLLAAHPKGPIPDEYRGVLKYWRQIKSAYLLHETAEKVIKEAQRRVREAFKERRVVSRGHFEGGIAFGVHADVYYWLVKAPTAQDGRFNLD